MYYWKEDIEDIFDLMEENNAHGDGDPFYSGSGEFCDSNEHFWEVLANISDRYGENDPIGFYRISKTSWLYDLLEEWYDEKEQDMEEMVRGFYDDGSYIFFVTGCNYDIYSADLLGGSADGEAQREFEKFADNR